MTNQEIVDKLTEIRYEANCTSMSPARLVADLIGVVLAQQEQIAALEQQVNELKMSATSSRRADRAASAGNPYDAGAGGFRNRR